LKVIGTTCAVCGEEGATPVHDLRDRLYRTTDEVFRLVRCIRCDLARLNPRPADLSPHYPEHYWYEPSRAEDCYRRMVLRDHVRFAMKAVRGRVRALDVGCGTGLFGRMLQEASGGAVRAFGVDVSRRAAAQARGRNGISVAVADLTRAPFAPASWDLITMFHVLEHAPDPGAMLDAARRLVAPGGALVAQVPNLDAWQYRMLGARWAGLDAPRHLYDFRFRDLKRLLEGHGFQVVRVKHFSWRDNAAALVTSIIPRLTPGVPGGGAARSIAYAGLVAAVLPFAALESTFGCGASVMVEANLA
jgi:SAM-dependent methyltransferase